MGVKAVTYIDDVADKNNAYWVVEYTGEGIVVEAVVDPILYGRLKDYVTKEC